VLPRRGYLQNGSQGQAEPGDTERIVRWGGGMIIFDNRMMRREDHLAVVKEYGGICEELRAAIYGGQEQIASLQAKLAEKEE
jgi:hypothetical protein